MGWHGMGAEKSEGKTAARRVAHQEEIEAPPVSPQAPEGSPGKSAAAAWPDAPDSAFQNQVQFDSLLDTLDQIGNGAVLLNAAGQVLDLNPAARRHVGAGIALNRDRLGANDPGSDAELQALLRSLKPDHSRSRGRSVTLSRPNAPPLFAHVLRLNIDSNARTAAAGLLILTDPLVRREPSPALLAQAFGFTPAEARLASGLAQGLDLQEISQIHRVSVGTLRVQLKSIFAKTQTKRQAQLAVLLARLSF
jgi:DNA-binding CsgD family transcriptional regulator